MKMKSLQNHHDKSLTFYLAYNQNKPQKRNNHLFNKQSKMRTLETQSTDLGSQKISHSLHNPKIMQKNINKIKRSNKQHSASFYDSFQFVDRLTNNKMAYKQARRTTTNSFTNIKRSDDPQYNKMSNLYSIYKKTKKFQINSLKQRIFKTKSFKNITMDYISRDQQHQNEPYKVKQNKNSQNHYEQFSTPSCQNINPIKRIKTDTKLIKSESIKQKQLKQKCKLKNKLKKHIDKTLLQINRLQFQKIIKHRQLTLPQEIIYFNQNKNIIKSQLKPNQIAKLNELREKIRFQSGLKSSYKIKQDQFVFKDLSNFIQNDHQKHLYDQQKELQTHQIRNKQKTKIKFNFRDQFMQKMLIHAHNALKKQGQHLIKPSKQKQARNILLKKGTKKYLFNDSKQVDRQNGHNLINQTQNSIDITQLNLKQKQQSSLVRQVKKELINRSKFTKSIFQIDQTNKLINTDHKYQCDQNKIDQGKTRQIIHYLKHNFVSNLSIELGTDPSLWRIKDQKDNNLVHIAIKNQKYQVLQLILKKLPYEQSKYLLQQKNLYKRTPKQVSELLCDYKALQIIQNFKQQNKSRQMLANYLKEHENQILKGKQNQQNLCQNKLQFFEQ